MSDLASPPVEIILEEAGFEYLSEDTPPKMLLKMLESVKTQAKELDDLTRGVLREALVSELKVAGVQRPGQMADLTLGKRTTTQEEDQGRAIVLVEKTEPYGSPVNGAELLSEIQVWLRRYVYASEASVAAIALWAVCTWFVSKVYFAPILAILSPTKRAGKSLLLDLLRWICWKPVATSGIGVTAAVMFRLNEQHQPTFLIDEAEKLSGKNGSLDIIGLLNQGYRRGGKVHRCRETSDGHVVDEFDAFGFRAVAAIGTLWDTLIDRAVVTEMQRKPIHESVHRFDGRLVEAEGGQLARKICRFVEDHLEDFENAEKVAPRPKWLNDRACDNWAALFAVGHLAGGNWPTIVLDAAKSLSNTVEDGDRGELLIQDVRGIFHNRNFPEVVRSQDLAEDLNAIESSLWGDYGKGKGISTHKLAAMFKPFKLRPRQKRDSYGEKVRGYWLEDLKKVFERYPPPSEVGQVGQPNNDAGFSDFQSGTEEGSCPTSESAETLASTGLSHLSHFESPPDGYDDPSHDSHSQNEPERI